ncbi:MAG: thioredoxin domain-containing protein, partial [Mariprofundus sp.]|nr:thioredoxin domain-containing protein [Mariprofundus sp.]
MTNIFLISAWSEEIHMAKDEPKYTNALIHESSPYLQQHAHNPVNWLPWGEDAFALARMQNKPVFLSIGYSTCHWCHVMEHESFEDPDVAEVLNRYFITIKVDREERPDIDAVYMHAAQMINGSGGWPLNLL